MRKQAKFIGVRATEDTPSGLEAGKLYYVDTSWAAQAVREHGAMGLCGRLWVGGTAPNGPRDEHDEPFWFHVVAGGVNPDKVKMVFQAHV